MYVLEHPTPEYRGLILLCQPRTASTTIGMELVRLGARKVGGHHDYTDMAMLESYFVVTGVRDHVTAVPSFYGREIAGRKGAAYRKLPVPGTDLYTEDMTLEEYVEVFLKNHAWVRMNRLYWRYLWLADYVYRFETLKRDWNAICGRMGMPRLTLSKWYQRTDHPGLNGEQAARVSEFFEQERRELGYP